MFRRFIPKFGRQQREDADTARDTAIVRRRRRQMRREAQAGDMATVERPSPQPTPVDHPIPLQTPPKPETEIPTTQLDEAHQAPIPRSVSEPPSPPPPESPVSDIPPTAPKMEPVVDDIPPRQQQTVPSSESCIFTDVQLMILSRACEIPTLKQIPVPILNATSIYTAVATEAISKQQPFPYLLNVWNRLKLLERIPAPAGIGTPAECVERVFLNLIFHPEVYGAAKKSSFEVLLSLFSSRATYNRTLPLLEAVLSNKAHLNEIELFVRALITTIHKTVSFPTNITPPAIRVAFALLEVPSFRALLPKLDCGLPDLSPIFAFAPVRIRSLPSHLPAVIETETLLGVLLAMNPIDAMNSRFVSCSDLSTSFVGLPSRLLGADPKNKSDLINIVSSVRSYQSQLTAVFRLLLEDETTKERILTLFWTLAVYDRQQLMSQPTPHCFSIGTTYNLLFLLAQLQSPSSSDYSLDYLRTVDRIPFVENHPSQIEICNQPTNIQIFTIVASLLESNISGIHNMRKRIMQQLPELRAQGIGLVTQMERFLKVTTGLLSEGAMRLLENALHCLVDVLEHNLQSFSNIPPGIVASISRVVGATGAPSLISKCLPVACELIVRKEVFPHLEQRILMMMFPINTRQPWTNIIPFDNLVVYYTRLFELFKECDDHEPFFRLQLRRMLNITMNQLNKKIGLQIFTRATKEADNLLIRGLIQAILGDTNKILDVAIEKLDEIDMDSANLPQVVEHVNGMAEGAEEYMLFLNSFIKAIPELFLNPAIGQNFVTSGLHFLETLKNLMLNKSVLLSNSRCRNLKQQLTTVFMQFLTAFMTLFDKIRLIDRLPELIDFVATDARTYRTGLFSDLASHAMKLGVRSPGNLKWIDELTEERVQLRQHTNIDEICMTHNIEIPLEFRDPVLYSVMRNPVHLGDSGFICDKDSVEPIIVETNANPFTREPLSIDDLRPDVELKARIESWIQETIASIHETETSSALQME